MVLFVMVKVRNLLNGICVSFVGIEISVWIVGSIWLKNIVVLLWWLNQCCVLLIFEGDSVISCLWCVVKCFSCVFLIYMLRKYYVVVLMVDFSVLIMMVSISDILFCVVRKFVSGMMILDGIGGNRCLVIISRKILVQFQLLIVDIIQLNM